MFHYLNYIWIIYFWVIHSWQRLYLPCLQLGSEAEPQIWVTILHITARHLHVTEITCSQGWEWTNLHWVALVSQAPPGGVWEATESAWGAYHAKGVSKVWLRPPIALGKTLYSVFGKLITPTWFNFWELFSSGFWQFYPHASARQPGWMSLKRCQWQMSGLMFWWLCFLHFGIQLLFIKEVKKPWRTWREKPFVSRLTPDGSPPPCSSQTGETGDRGAGITQTFSSATRQPVLLRGNHKTTCIGPCQINALWCQLSLLAGE